MRSQRRLPKLPLIEKVRPALPDHFPKPKRSSTQVEGRFLFSKQ
jgi:hypothetical protein